VAPFANHTSPNLQCLFLLARNPSERREEPLKTVGCAATNYQGLSIMITLHFSFFSHITFSSTPLVLPVVASQIIVPYLSLRHLR
jgi:hypothetical protein